MPPTFIPKKSKCEHIRLTVKEDVTTPEGRNLAIRAVRANNTLLWPSMPCTGGSPWQEINKLKPGGLKRLRKHIRDLSGYGEPLSRSLLSATVTEVPWR